MNDCPSNEVLVRLLAEQLCPGDEQLLEAHVAACTSCQMRLDRLTQGPTLPPTSGEPKNDAVPIFAQVAKGVRTAAKSQKSTRGPEATKDFVPVVERSRGGRSTILFATGRFLRSQFWTWPLIAALVLGSAGWWVHQSIESAMRQQRINELTTILDADVAAVEAWMSSQRAMVELVADDENLAPLVLALRAESSTNRLRNSPALAALRDRLAGPLRRGGYAGFILVAPSGLVLAADQDAPIGQMLTGYEQEFFDAVTGGQSSISRPFRSAQPLVDAQKQLQVGLPCMYAAAPIEKAADEWAAALGLRLRLEGQFTDILRVARSGQTGETYAFDRDGLMLSQSRFDEPLKQIGLLVDRPDSHSILTIEVRDPLVNMVAGERPTIRRPERPLTRMAEHAVQGQAGHDVNGYRDYRGALVVGAWRWLDHYNFGVATEMDVAEAFQPVHILRRAFGLLLGLLLLSAAGMFLASYYMAWQQRALRRAARTVHQLGQYTLLEKIGSGGMGTVYKAQHALLRRPTAVKLLKPEIMSPQSIARFEREVQLTSTLTHPHTVMIFDFGHTPEGIFYYAMEYLEGVNLSELVNRHGPVPESRLKWILGQACASLAEAHAAGLIHRDIKPANVLLTCRGGQRDFVKVVDFGLVKPLDRQDQFSITSPNSLAGTPHYLAPEAVNQPELVDARTDVYALGAVGYFLLTGTTVFGGSNVLEICLKHVREAPEPPSTRVGRSVSLDLESLLLACLAKAPADRPADAGQLLQQLERCAVAGSWSEADAARWWADHHPGAFSRSQEIQPG